MVAFHVVPERTALVNVDLQNFFVENAPDGLTVLERVNQFAAGCRKAGTGHPHQPCAPGRRLEHGGARRPCPSREKEEGFLNEGTRTAALHDDLVIEPGDILLEKPRFGAFHGTDLELILRQRGIDTIIISGISTPVCCDTTAREANARDFRVLFLRDGTASTGDDAEEATRYQRATLEIIDGLFGQVLAIDEVLQKITKPTGPGVSATST